MVGILVSFWDGPFSGAMLVSGPILPFRLLWNHFSVRWTLKRSSTNCKYIFPWNTGGKPTDELLNIKPTKVASTQHGPYRSPKLAWTLIFGGSIVQFYIPSRKLTYPTWGKGKSSTRKRYMDYMGGYTVYGTVLRRG